MKHLFLLTLITFSSFSFAEAEDYKTVAYFKGDCSSAMINSIDVTDKCLGTAEYRSYKSGHLAFLFYLENLLVSFLGNQDSQLSESLYTLKINSITTFRIQNDVISLSTKTINMQGTCQIKGDSIKQASIICEAVEDQKDIIEIHFQIKEVDKIQPFP